MELASLAVLTIVLVLAIVRAMQVRDVGSQAMILEMSFMIFVAILVVIGSVMDTEILFDVLLIASVLGFLFIMGLARLLTRGQR